MPKRFSKNTILRNKLAAVRSELYDARNVIETYHGRQRNQAFHVEQLTNQVSQLQREIDDARRVMHRYATPFSPQLVKMEMEQCESIAVAPISPVPMTPRSCPQPIKSKIERLNVLALRVSHDHLMTEQAHCMVLFAGKQAAVYAANDAALRRMPREILARHIADDLANHLVKELGRA